MKSITTIEELQQNMTKGKRNFVLLGIILLCLAISTYGLSLSTIQTQVLESMDAIEHFSLVTILGSLGMCLMTPVGGKLSDMYGSRNVVLWGSIIAGLSGIALAFCSSFIPFILFRMLLAFGIGSFISVPFILVREIFPINMVPRLMGLLTAIFSIGGLLGGFIAGFFVDHNLMFFAICFPVVFMLPGALIIYFSLPQKPVVHKPFDIIGFLVLALGLSCLFISLNFATRVGWHNPFIILGLVVGVVSIPIFILVEKRVSEPLMPLRLFANERFVILILIGFFSFFYFNGMNVYVPSAVVNILGASATTTGSLQIPRTIVVVILPFILGLWVIKKVQNNWLSLALAGLLVGIAFAFLVFVGPNMPIWFIMAMLALTGIAEAFRSVSYTPAVQSTLSMSDLGIGTSLTSFFNSLSGVIAATLMGFAYDTLIKTHEGLKGMTMGVDTVFLICAVSGFIAFLLVVASYIPLDKKYLREQQEQKEEKEKEKEISKVKEIKTSSDLKTQPAK